MIHIVCGMIGAGKTTYCKNQQGVVTDFDEMTSKQEQIEETIALANADIEVWHITTYPSENERLAFENYEKEYIWINTSFSKCKENILMRKRERDLRNLNETLISNRRIRGMYQCTSLDFKVVNVFEQHEEW